jgi:hypothetical protein
MIGKDEIDNRFGFHKATIEGNNATVPDHTLVRQLYKRFAERLDEILPDEMPRSGRSQKEIAFERLEEASMWSHKAIAGRAPLIDERG